MADLKIGIGAKLTKIEWDMRRHSLSREQVLELYLREGKDADKIIASHERQKRCIEAIISSCPSALHISVPEVPLGAQNPLELDFLIAIGGDNFFQICSHRFPDAYLVGVNSDPESSHGALLNFSYSTLLPRLRGILGGDFRTEHWTRVATELNGRRLEDATCTISLSIKATDMISRYLLSANGTSEEQKSTGILVVTGSGSGEGAWYRNAGLYLPQIKSDLYSTVTQEFPRESGTIKTLTREPFNAAECPYRLLNANIGPEGSANLVYWANDPSELSVDSIERYEVKEGDLLTFRASEKRLKVVARD